MKVKKSILVLVLVSAISVGLIGCSKSEESEINDIIPEDEYTTEEVVDNNKYEDDFERALAEYTGNMDSIEDECYECEDNRVINNGLKELSREEFVDPDNSTTNTNPVKIVLDGKIVDCRNFEPTIRKEVADFIKNRGKYPSSQGYYLNISNGIYAIHRRIEISADDMEMYALLEYGETDDGKKWIMFHAMDNDITMKKVPETFEEREEASRQDNELRRLLLDLEKSLNNEYGGMLHPEWNCDH
jgi:hypothetical protein